MKKGVLILVISLMVIFAGTIPVTSAGLTITTSTSSGEMTTGGSVTLTVDVSNTGTSSQSGITIELDLTSANGGLSLNATSVKLKDQTESQTIAAGGSISKTWTIYGVTAGTYTNQIQINVKQNGADISGSPVYESVSVKDPASFATPSISTATSVTQGDTFYFNLTTQNSGDYAIQNVVATISAPDFTVVSSSGTTQSSISPDAVFAPSWKLSAESAGTKTVTVTLSSDNAASVSVSRSITVSGTSTPTPTPTPTPTSTRTGGGGGGGGSAEEANVPVDLFGVVKSTTTLRSEDGMVALTVQEGTLAKDAAGNPLSTVTMMKRSITGTLMAYELGPGGATFDPPVKLEFKYDPTTLPEGASEEDLVIKVYRDGSWVALDTVIDTENHVASTEVDHFTLFALMLKESAPIVEEAPPSAITATPTRVSPEEEVETPGAETPAESKKGMYAIIAGAVILLAIAGWWLYYYRKKRE